ncbi:MAG: hypothetical protein M1163_05125 [Candidatus Thermoplasmatota archaeon]|nr:hypothetical protein [Candidatus Thermoplasmatota archaeon]
MGAGHTGKRTKEEIESKIRFYRQRLEFHQEDLEYLQGQVRRCRGNRKSMRCAGLRIRVRNERRDVEEFKEAIKKEEQEMKKLEDVEAKTEHEVIMQILRNEKRVVILKGLIEKKEMSWAELVNTVRGQFNTGMSPNTVAFHLKFLMDRKIVLKTDDRYVLSDSNLTKKLISEV